MQVHIHTDKNIEGHERLEQYITSVLETALTRFEDKITTLSVHFGDENGAKNGQDDKRCLIEVRLEKVSPLAVTEHADATEKAFQGALAKIKKVLTTHFDKVKAH